MSENIQLSVLDIQKKYTVDPEETTYGSGKLVTWGADNQLPVLYHNCYNQSATLKSVIDGTVNYILGDDIILGDSAAYWRKEVNRKGMTFRQYVSRVSWNLLTYGGYAVQVIYNKLGGVVELYPLDFGRCRLNETRDKVYYAKKWTKYQTKSEEYDIFNPDHINMDNPTQIFIYTGDLSNSVYPLPPYAGAIYDVLTEVECAKYSLNTVARGFSAKYILSFPETTNLTDEQKKGMEEAIKNKFCGSESDANFMMYWRELEGQDVEVKKIESDETPERYIAIKDNARQNIFIALRCTPLLFGLPNAANGFSTAEYRDSFKLYQKSVVEPLQDVILEGFEKITGVEDDIKIVPFAISFEEE